MTGLAPADAAVTISDNGVADAVATADDLGVFTAVAPLVFGANTLTATEGATNSSGSVVAHMALGPAILNMAPVVNQQAVVSGLAAPGAAVFIYEGNSSTGALLTNWTANSSGEFSGSVFLPLGKVTLTATEVISNQTNNASVPVSVDVVSTLPPQILSPANGLVTNKAFVTLSGAGISGAAVMIYNATSAGTNQTAATVKSNGKFSALVELADGANTLFATQKQTATSPASAPIVVHNYLSPEILVQPVNQTNFLKGSVTFSADVIGAVPLKFFWEKNGVNIPGAVSSTLTLANLTSNITTNRYTLTASNSYGVAKSSGVTVDLVSNPFLNLAGAYYGLFAGSNAPFESSGLLTLNLTSLGKFTARILNAGGSYSFSGALSGVGWWSNTVSRGSAKTPLSVLLNLDTTNGTEQILGGVSCGTNWTAPLQADRATFGKTNLFPDSGKFTLVFGSANAGDGYATVSVNNAGTVSLSGVLSDGAAVAPGAVSVSQYGQWPLYIPLYGRFGSLAGWIQFTNRGASVVNLTNNAPCAFAASNVTWIRTNAGGKLYPDGFTNTLTVIGSTFASSNNAALLDVTNLQVILSGGNLPEPLTNSVTASAKGKFTANGSGIPGLALSLNPATGVIKGAFSNPSSTPIKGVILQEQTNAAGFILSGTNNGFFLLTPP